MYPKHPGTRAKRHGHNYSQRSPRPRELEIERLYRTEEAHEEKIYGEVTSTTPSQSLPDLVRRNIIGHSAVQAASRGRKK
jgi:hypothetical protein